jgi:hypothetical protein
MSHPDDICPWQDRFDALVLYIAHRTQADPRFGRVKLARVLYYADLDAYREAGESITGGTYIRLPFGPFPQELEDAEQRLTRTGQVNLVYEVGEGEEKKIIPSPGVRSPDLQGFGYADWQIMVVDNYIKMIAAMTATEVSDQTHREAGWIVAEKTGRTISYAAAFVPNRPPTNVEVNRALQVARKRGWLTNVGWEWERERA